MSCAPGRPGQTPSPGTPLSRLRWPSPARSATGAQRAVGRVGGRVGGRRGGASCLHRCSFAIDSAPQGNITGREGLRAGGGEGGCSHMARCPAVPTCTRAASDTIHVATAGFMVSQPAQASRGGFASRRAKCRTVTLPVRKIRRTTATGTMRIVHEVRAGEDGAGRRCRHVALSVPPLPGSSAARGHCLEQLTSGRGAGRRRPLPPLPAGAPAQPLALPPAHPRPAARSDGVAAAAGGGVMPCAAVCRVHLFLPIQ